MKDLILVIRADEACHSHVNHTFAVRAHADGRFFVFEAVHAWCSVLGVTDSTDGHGS